MARPALNQFDIFADAPFGHGYIHPLVIRALAPEARFIWVNRDFDDWIESLCKWELSHPNTYSQKRRARWQQEPAAMIELMRQRWDLRYKAFLQVTEVFPSYCLELNLDDFVDYAALAAFYSVSLPAGARLKLNTSDT
ncbi:MAG: sulfotransferase [Pseudomonadota bacterium]